ncbi:MAG: hypothetical protein WAQ28_16760 [Bacteroidia bacterium]|jgi:hypothetical protein
MEYKNTKPMNNQPQIKISIPELCHEDWNKMTPNEKGAFCSKCCKTVVDFTQKSAEEIRNILLQEAGKKVCGKFTSDQLDEPKPQTVNLTIPVHLLPRPVSPVRRFAIALFIAFGTTLFSCGTYNNTVIGDIQIDSTTVIADTTETATIDIPQPTTSTQFVAMKGEISAVPVPNQDTLKKTNIEPELLGRVHIHQKNATEKDTLKKEEVTRPVPKMGKIKVSGK